MSASRCYGIMAMVLAQRHNIARSPTLYFSNTLNKSWLMPSGGFQLSLSGLLLLLHLSRWVCKWVCWWRLYSDEDRNSCPQSLQMDTMWTYMLSRCLITWQDKWLKIWFRRWCQYCLWCLWWCSDRMNKAPRPAKKPKVTSSDWLFTVIIDI